MFAVRWRQADRSPPVSKVLQRSYSRYSTLSQVHPLLGTLLDHISPHHPHGPVTSPSHSLVTFPPSHFASNHPLLSLPTPFPYVISSYSLQSLYLLHLSFLYSRAALARSDTTLSQTLGGLMYQGDGVSSNMTSVAPSLHLNDLVCRPLPPLPLPFPSLPLHHRFTPSTSFSLTTITVPFTDTLIFPTDVQHTTVINRAAVKYFCIFCLNSANSYSVQIMY